MQDPRGGAKDKPVEQLAGRQGDSGRQRATEEVEARQGGETKKQQRMLRGNGREAESLEESFVVLDLANHELPKTLSVTANSGAEEG